MVERVLKRAEEAGDEARNDDNEEILRNRIKIFQEQSTQIYSSFEFTFKFVKFSSDEYVYEHVQNYLFWKYLSI